MFCVLNHKILVLIFLLLKRQDFICLFILSKLKALQKVVTKCWCNHVLVNLLCEFLTSHSAGVFHIAHTTSGVSVLTACHLWINNVQGLNDYHRLHLLNQTHGYRLNPQTQLLIRVLKKERRHYLQKSGQNYVLALIFWKLPYSARSVCLASQPVHICTTFSQ